MAQRATAHWERADGYVTFVDYVENIYVGYKFYETADAVGMSGFDYDSAVTYPFGFGLSYTTFDQSIANTTRNGDSVTVTVNVTNTGSVAGKSIVELYDTPPYTEGGLGLSEAVFTAPFFLPPVKTTLRTLDFSGIFFYNEKSNTRASAPEREDHYGKRKK